MIGDDGFSPPPIFYEVMAKYCRCCRSCGDVPCPGVCAGGLCDQASCRCDDEYDDLEYGSEDECTSP